MIGDYESYPYPYSFTAPNWDPVTITYEPNQVGTVWPLDIPVNPAPQPQVVWVEFVPHNNRDADPMGVQWHYAPPSPGDVVEILHFERGFIKLKVIERLLKPQSVVCFFEEL